jgi:AbrB family looped-hinge helix DNA binding protein
MDRSDLLRSVEGLPTKSAKIRALNAKGIARVDIARLLGIRYQFVRNVLVADDAKSKTAKDVVTARLDSAGRVLIPADIRKALGVSEGDQVKLELDDDGLRIISRKAAIRKAQDVFRKYAPDGVSLRDELIAERRQAANNE